LRKNSRITKQPPLPRWGVGGGGGRTETERRRQRHREREGGGRQRGEGEGMIYRSGPGASELQKKRGGDSKEEEEGYLPCRVVYSGWPP
jgi:hypothetical protein